MMAGYEAIKEISGNLPAIRCSCCNRLLYRGIAQTIEIKCPKCGIVHTVKGCEIPRLNADIHYQERWRQKGTCPAELPSRVVIDSAGRVVVVPARPQRVIALNASNLGLFYATGGEVVARTATSLLSPELKEKVKHVPTVGIPPQPDVEQIIAMKPDLVLGMHAPMHHAVAAALEQRGIPVLLQALEDYAGVLKTLQLYGDLSGKPEQAASKISAIENKRKELLRLYCREVAPKVLILWQIAEGMYTALSNSFIGDLVKRLGGLNVADLTVPIDEGLHYTPFCLESVVQFQPDVILIVSHNFAPQSRELPLEELMCLPEWRKLAAVQQQSVYQLPYQLFAVNPGPRMEEALMVLAEFLYKKQGY